MWKKLRLLLFLSFNNLLMIRNIGCFLCYDELLECVARLYKLFDEDTERMIDMISRSDILHCLQNKLCL